MSNKFAKGLLYGIVGLGIVLRFWVFFQNRSLWLDEANLALNIVQKNYLDFFSPLEFFQHAPPFYLILCKLSTQLFAVSEQSLRLPALIAGILSMFLFYKITLILIKNRIAQVYSLLIFSLSGLFINYATEVKQYGVDAFLTLLLIYFALKTDSNKYNWKDYLIWALSGAICIWLSMPSIIILATIGILFLYKAIQCKSKIGWVISTGAFWILNFGIYYISLLQYSLKDSGLHSYHQQFFFDFTPTSTEAIFKDLFLIDEVLTSVMSYTFIPQLFVVIAISIAIFSLYRFNKKTLFLLAFPVLLIFILSHFHSYSLISRLTLFFIPLLMLLVAIGSEKALGVKNRFLQVIVVSLMVLSLSNNLSLKHFKSPIENTDNVFALDFIQKNNQDNSIILINKTGRAAFQFYNDYHKNKYSFPNYSISTSDNDLFDKLENLKTENQGHCWLFLSHAHEIDWIGLEKEIKEDFIILNYAESKRVKVLELKPKN